MGDSPNISPLTLVSLPVRTRHQFDAALQQVHQELLDEVHAFEDRQGPGPQLKTTGGAVEFEVVLRVRVGAVIDSGNVSQVTLQSSVERKHPGFKPQKSGAYMRKSGLFVEEEQEAEVLPFGRSQSRVS